MATSKMNIRNVACVGMGLIGYSWASLFSLKDLNIYIYDISEEILSIALRRIESNLIFYEEHKIIQEGETEKALDKMRAHTFFNSLSRRGTSLSP